MSLNDNRSPIIWICLAISVVLHVALVWIGEIQHRKIEADEFRVRLAHYTIHKPRRPAPVPIPPPTHTRMEYLPAGGTPAELDDADETPIPEVFGLTPVLPWSTPHEVGPVAKSTTPILAQERMLSPHDMGLAGSLSSVPMELLRWEDMARANKEHAAVIPNVASPRDVEGFINFTRIRVYGAGSDSEGSLDALAHFMRDNTGILAQVRGSQYKYFLSDQLLKDPIHFMVEGHGLQAYDSSALTRFSTEELDLLRRYLEVGGFLFLEGGNRYLREMIKHLRAIIGVEGGIFEVLPVHPLYHAFYSFDLGFPGEDKVKAHDWGQSSWYYPRSSGFIMDTGSTAEAPPPIGIYGINFRGQMVGVLSDLGLADRWNGIWQDEEPEQVEDHKGALIAATNIVVYALTRPGSLTLSYAKPVWAIARPTTPADQPLILDRAESDFEYELGDLSAELDSYIALLHSPLGEGTTNANLTLSLDGTFSLPQLKAGIDGLMLHNLPAGPHWIELSYGGKQKQLEVDLVGGKVSTAAFFLDKFAFFTHLNLRLVDEPVDVADWRKAFGDLVLEEVFLGGDTEIFLRRVSE